jgi:hypothetical protein
MKDAEIQGVESYSLSSDYKLALTLLPEFLAICRLESSQQMPGWSDSSRFLSITRTQEENSIVCEQSLVPPEVLCESDWRALKVAGPLDFSLTGILTSLLTPLAKAGLSVFAISTFDTDYVLIKHSSLELAITVLRAAGHQVDTL